MTELHSLLYSGITLLSTAIIILVWFGTLPSLSETGSTTSFPTRHWCFGRTQTFPIRGRIEVDDETDDVSIITRFFRLGRVEY